MSISIRVLVIGLILLLLDIYFYQAIVVIFKGASPGKKNIVFYVYWGFSLVSFLTILTPAVFVYHDLPKFFRIYVVMFFVMVIISKLIGSVFIGIDDIIRFFRWIVSFFIKPTNTAVVSELVTESTNKISRLTFLNRVAVTMAALPFISFMYGMVKGAFN